MQYEIKGAPMPVVICKLQPNESVVCESGSMSWMTNNVEMNTGSNGGVKKILSRMFTGERMFQNQYVAKNCEGLIAFASSFPGDIVPLNINKGEEYIVQKGAFLAGAGNLDLSIYLQKKIGAGLFGGDGFIMQKLSGEGIAFLEVDGSAVEYTLSQGEQMLIDTGYLVMMSGTCKIDIVGVKGVKNVLFGGEGLFNTVVTGPGKIVLQSMPIHKTAMSIYPYLPKNNN